MPHRGKGEGEGCEPGAGLGTGAGAGTEEWLVHDAGGSSTKATSTEWESAKEELNRIAKSKSAATCRTWN